MENNDQDFGKLNKMLKDALVTWEDAQSSVEYVSEKCKKNVTKLYWLHVKMENYRQIFQTEQLEEADSLCNEFSQLSDMYAYISKQLEEQRAFIKDVTELYDREGIWNCSVEVIQNFLRKQVVCQSKMQDCASKEWELLPRIEALQRSLVRKDKGCRGMKWRGLRRGIDKICRDVSDSFK